MKTTNNTTEAMPKLRQKLVRIIKNVQMYYRWPFFKVVEGTGGTIGSTAVYKLEKRMWAYYLMQAVLVPLVILIIVAGAIVELLSLEMTPRGAMGFPYQSLSREERKELKRRLLS